MSDKVPIPIYTVGKSIETYEREVEAWRQVTSYTDKKKQAIVLTLALSDELKEHVWDNISEDDLKKDEGVTTYLAFLKASYGGDELLDSLENYRNFQSFRRREGQSINDYITEFNAKINKVQKKGTKIPTEILAFELMTKARIDPSEQKLVVTGIDFKKKVCWMKLRLLLKSL